MTNDFLEVDDLGAARLRAVLANAVAWKADPLRVPSVLAGKGVVTLFQKPSARTRVSTEMAVSTLGGHPIHVRDEEVGIGTRETPDDVARTFASFCAVIAARVFSHALLEQFAAAVDIPVVNLLSDTAHPCQAVADLLTLQEVFGALEGLRLAYVGDGNNVAASLAIAGALAGVEIVVASPAGYELPAAVVARARELGGTVELVPDPADAVRGAHAVYTDVWVSMGDEAERAERMRAFSGWTIDADLMKHAGEDAVFLHCLPAHRGEEVTAEVIDGARSRVWQQAENRMHAARAVLVAVLEGGTLMATLGKPQRQHRILRVIEEQPVSSQSQLVQLLEAEGIVATQATVSRDLEELGAVKVRIPGGATAYAIPEFTRSGRAAPDDHLKRLMGEFVVEVAYSANLVVLRTPPGSAHVVASALDRAGLADLVGTVAGDDTVLVIAKESTGGATVAADLAALAGL